MDTVEDLKQIAAGFGATLGVTGCEPFPEVAEEMYSRIEAGRSARLGFTYKDPDKATQPERSFPWGRSIVVVAMGYLLDGDGPSNDRPIARFADGDRYVELRRLVGDIAVRLGADGWRAEAVIDDDRLVDRAVAVRAGVGWWGKSTMVLTPGHGPWILLGSVVTDAVLPTNEPMKRSCGTCDACIPACPTGAIFAPGVLDARRCLAAIFQSRGDIPVDLRKAAGGRIYGCDDCLTACPPGSRELRSKTAADHEFGAVEALQMSDEELRQRTEHWYVPGRKMRFVRRNAIVALGNTGGVDAVAVLEPYLTHQDDLLRRHAQWAVDQLT